jgi:hypothetical protein
MKLLFKLGLLLFLLSATSCYSQQMVRKTTEVKVLQNKKEEFIGKPLSELLKQIGPQIKYVYGNPENTWAGAVGGTYLKFHFIDRNEYGNKLKGSKKPTAIVVSFKLDANNKHRPLPKEGLNEWTEEQTKEYGDMIISNIRVIEEN